MDAPKAHRALQGLLCSESSPSPGFHYKDTPLLLDIDVQPVLGKDVRIVRRHWGTARHDFGFMALKLPLEPGGGNSTFCGQLKCCALEDSGAFGPLGNPRGKPSVGCRTPDAGSTATG